MIGKKTLPSPYDDPRNNVSHYPLCCNVLSLLPSQKVTVHYVLPAAAASVLRTFSQLNVLNLVTAGYIDFGGREGGRMGCEKAQEKSYFGGAISALT